MINVYNPIPPLLHRNHEQWFDLFHQFFPDSPPIPAKTSRQYFASMVQSFHLIDESGKTRPILKFTARQVSQMKMTRCQLFGRVMGNILAYRRLREEIQTTFGQVDEDGRPIAVIVDHMNADEVSFDF